MTVTMLTSREFNQDTGRAKKASRKGPVYITERGRLTHVLLSVDEYRQLARKEADIVQLLSMPEAADIDFAPPRLSGELFHTADLS